MGSFWVKIAVLGAICIGLVILVKNVKPPKLEMETKSLEAVLDKKDKELRADVTAVEPNEQAPEVVQELAAVVEETKPVAVESAPTVKPAIPVAPLRKLSEDDEIIASQLFEQAISMRKIAHVSRAGYKTTVETCREIIRRFPGTEWEIKAKRMMADIPERYHELYHITAEEIDTGNYK